MRKKVDFLKLNCLDYYIGKSADFIDSGINKIFYLKIEAKKHFKI